MSPKTPRYALISVCLLALAATAAQAASRDPVANDPARLARSHARSKMLTHSLLPHMLFGATKGGKPEIASPIVKPQPPSTTVTAPIAVVNAADYSTGPVAPGSWAAIFADGISDKSVVGTWNPTTLSFPTTLNGVQVLINGVAAQLLAVGPGQVNALIPPATTLTPGTASQPNVYPVQIFRYDGSAIINNFSVSDSSAGVFTVNQQGTGVAAAEALNGGANTPIFDTSTGNAVAVSATTQNGSNYLELYTTGLGNAKTSQVTATIGGISVPVAFAGPQGEEGLDQINLVLSDALAQNTNTDYEVDVSVNGQALNPVHVTIAGTNYQYQWYEAGRASWTVPANVDQLQASVWGGGGGDGGDCYDGTTGDWAEPVGQYSTATIPVIAGQAYSIYLQGGSYGGSVGGGSGGNGGDSAVYYPSGATLVHAYGASGGNGGSLYDGGSCDGYYGGNGGTGMATLVYNSDPSPAKPSGIQYINNAGYTYFTVPQGVNTIVIFARGGDWSYGGGGLDFGTLIVTPGEQLSIYIQNGDQGGAVAVYSPGGAQLFHATSTGDEDSGDVTISW